MRQYIPICLVLLVIGLAAVYRGTEATAVPAPAATPYKWEYHAVTELDLKGMTEQKTVEAALNKLGEEGWELTAIRSSTETVAIANANPRSLFCFKRLKMGK